MTHWLSRQAVGYKKRDNSRWKANNPCFLLQHKKILFYKTYRQANVLTVPVAHKKAVMKRQYVSKHWLTLAVFAKYHQNKIGSCGNCPVYKQM